MLSEGHVLWDAVELKPLASNLGFKVESVTGYENILVFGTDSGQLMSYSVNAASGEFQLKANKAVAVKRPITHLGIVPMHDLLFVFYDGIIQVHNLISLALIGNASTTLAKGCHIMVVNSRPVFDNETILIACAGKRKLLLLQYHITQNRFLSLKEMSLPHTSKAMTWLEYHVVMGFNQMYMIADCKTYSVKEVFSMSTKHVSLPIRVSPNEVMLTKDQVTSFHDPTGAPSREYRITWNDVPQSMVLHPPYVIAGTPRTIEVHILHTGELVEVLPEKAGQVVAARMLDVDERESGIAMNVDDSNATLILFERRLCTLELYNIVHQIKQLQHLGHWKEALHLSGYLPTTQIELREDIQREHAVALFAEKKFEKAMQHFKDCDTQVGIVLALYQHLLLPPDSEEPHSKISGIDEANLQPATLALIPYLDFKRTSGKLSREEATMVDTTLFKCYLYAKPSNLMTFLRKENQANLEDVRVLLERHKKFAELLNFLCARGHFEDAMKLLQKLTAESATFKLEDVGVYVRQFLNEGNAPPALLLDHMDWVFEKYDEKALDIVHDCVRFPPEVVLKHLETIKQGGLRLKYLENLLLPFLSKAADAKEREKYRQPVRKSVAAETTDAQLIKQTLMKAKLHDSLAMEYLTKINKFEKKPDGHAEFEKALQEFLSFLRMNPSYYNASAILDMVEDLKLEKLNPARAVLLSVMGKHASALRSFIKLKMFTEAEAHCQAYYDPANPEASGLFLELIKVCLDQTEDYQPQVDRAIEIFHRHFERIDVRKALEILPGNSSLTKLMPTLEAVIQRNNRAINENKLVKSLLIAEERQLRERLIRARSKKFKIGVKDMCAVCSKQIDRGQVFARYPNDVTVHGGCLTNPKKCPITGIEFSVDSQFEEL